MKYYDIHVFDGVNSYSVYVKVKDSLLLPKPKKEDIIGHAVDMGLLDPDDMKYVDKVNSISEFQYQKAIKA